jgi:acid phosphatase family membrane protein YuiD
LDKKLKELLGHSPIEVAAGALLGITVAVIAALVL